MKASKAAGGHVGGPRPKLANVAAPTSLLIVGVATPSTAPAPSPRDETSVPPEAVVQISTEKAEVLAENPAEARKPQGASRSKKGAPLQDPFLNLLRREHVPVSIYLMNGIKLQGYIESFDQYVVLLRNAVTQMVYKHAISTVVPGRPVKFETGEEEDQSKKG